MPSFSDSCFTETPVPLHDVLNATSTLVLTALANVLMRRASSFCSSDVDAVTVDPRSSITARSKSFFDSRSFFDAGTFPPSAGTWSTVQKPTFRQESSWYH